ncbi:MAG: SLATT domain-containing protein [Azoarcus sp.]|jgi:hypothetical protein|nr:SLATT domain-containing protein [Azoarcus sp.]
MPEQYEVHSPATKRSVAGELSQLENDCARRGAAQAGAAARWRRWHYCIGTSAVALSVLACMAFSGNHPVLAAMLSALLAVLTAVMTFMKPSGRACAHKAAGDRYRALCSEACVFREIRLFHACDDQSAIAGLEAFLKRRNELDEASLQVCRCDEKRARESGEAVHLDGKQGADNTADK